MKKLLMLPLLIAMLFTSCSEAIVTPETYTDILLETDRTSVHIGDTFTISIATEDNRALNPFAWAPDLEGIVSETEADSSSITFRAEKEGRVSISVTESVTGKSAEIEMTVTRDLPDLTGPYGFRLNGNVIDRETGLGRPFGDGDRLILLVMSSDGKLSYNILAASDSGKCWLYDEEGRRPAELDGSKTEGIRAYYAPSFEIAEGSIRRRPDYSGRVGRLYRGDNEFLAADGRIDRKTGTITFDFERNSSALVIHTRPNTRIRVNITDFHAADFQNEDSNYSETILTGDGKVEIYGTWKETSEIQIIHTQYGRQHETRAFLPPFSTGNAAEITISLQVPEPVITRDYVQAENFMNLDLRSGIHYFPGQMDQKTLNMCWAASSSFLLNWWAWQNEKASEGKLEPSVPPYPMDESDIYSYTTRTEHIFNVFVENFLNQGFDPILAMRWFLSGETSPTTDMNLRPGSSHDGFFDSSTGITDLIWDFEENHDNPEKTGDMEALEERYRNVSMEIYGILSEGNPLVIQNQNHAFNIWAAGFDTDTGLVTRLWISNSNGAYIEGFNPYGIGILTVGLKDGSIVLNSMHTDDDGTVHAPDDDPLTHLSTIIRNHGSIRYIAT